jgi:prepilin-type N-terminal cleavage/methylation domain-containing protein
LVAGAGRACYREAMKNLKRGFTLIELMIVVAIIGILAAIAVPKFADLIRKSTEGASKGNLGSIRSALSIYYGDMEGQYPSSISGLTVGGKYLAALPMSKAPNYHQDSALETGGLLTVGNAITDAGGWSYNNVAGDSNAGSLAVNCTHTDTKGSIWTSY